MLQGRALYTVSNRLGYSVDLISYDVRKNPNPVYPSVLKQFQQYGFGAALSKVREKTIGKGKFLIRDLLTDRIDKFSQFMADTNADTNLYDDDSMLVLKKEYKTFVSGSDQIWNPNAVRNLYLQTFLSS